MNVISRVGIAIGKNKFVMNAVIDQNEQFWLELEYEVSEWKINCNKNVRSKIIPLIL